MRGIRLREFMRFIQSLEKLPDMVTEFSEELWGSLVDHVTVHSKDNCMLLNNIELDVKTKCIEEKISQQQVGEDIGTSGPYVSRLINHPEKIVNKTFLAMMERLGYDVRMTYEKRETAE